MGAERERQHRAQGIAHHTDSLGIDRGVLAQRVEAVVKFPDPPGERLADFRLLPRYDFFARGVVFDHLSVVALRREIPADLLQVVIAGTMNFRTMDQYHRWM